MVEGFPRGVQIRRCGVESTVVHIGVKGIYRVGGVPAASRRIDAFAPLFVQPALFFHALHGFARLLRKLIVSVIGDAALVQVELNAELQEQPEQVRHGVPIGVDVQPPQFIIDGIDAGVLDAIRHARRNELLALMGERAAARPCLRGHSDPALVHGQWHRPGQRLLPVWDVFLVEASEVVPYQLAAVYPAHRHALGNVPQDLGEALERLLLLQNTLRCPAFGRQSEELARVGVIQDAVQGGDGKLFRLHLLLELDIELVGHGIEDLLGKCVATALAKPLLVAAFLLCVPRYCADPILRSLVPELDQALGFLDGGGNGTFDLLGNCNSCFAAYLSEPLTVLTIVTAVGIVEKLECGNTPVTFPDDIIPWRLLTGWQH